MAGLSGYLRTIPALGWLALAVAVLVLLMIADLWGGEATGLYVGIIGVVVAVVAAIDASLSSAKVADAGAHLEGATAEIQATTRAIELADRLERIAGVADALNEITTADLFDLFGEESIGRCWERLRQALARAEALNLEESEAVALVLLSYTDRPTNERGELRRMVDAARTECMEAREASPTVRG